MRAYYGKVYLHNGHYNRKFEVRVSALSWHVAGARAIRAAIEELKIHLRAMGIHKRISLEDISISLMRGMEMQKGDRSLVRPYVRRVN